MKPFVNFWKRYKYRFVPWLIFNMDERILVNSIQEKERQLYSEINVIPTLLTLFEEFSKNLDTACSPKEQHQRNCQIMESQLGFSIQRQKSTLAGGGLGVKVSQGKVHKGQIVALYPGTIYKPSEPIFIQSIGNSFIFKCLDGIFIDGNDKSLSKYIYRSCVLREKLGPYLPADLSWLEKFPINPLAVGQYVNNQSPGNPNNVIYQEYDIERSINATLHKYIPNITYDPVSLSTIRIVALIAVQDITAGEELFSSYFNVVNISKEKGRL